MADNGNREPTEPFRRGVGKKRREPPIIDASATSVPVEPSAAEIPVETAGPVVPPAEPAPAQPAEPVLFGSALRDPAQRSRETESDIAASSPRTIDDTVAGSPVDFSGPGVESEVVSAGASASSSEPDSHPASRADTVPPFEVPARPRTGLVPGLLGLLVLVLLGTVAWLFFAGPQRSGQEELAGNVADLQTKVAALEARQDPGQVTNTVADLNKRVGAADADRAGTAQTLAQLTKRVDDIDQQMQAAKAAASAKPAEAAPPAAEPKPAEPAFATLAAVAALAGKVDAIEGRISGLANDQGDTAKTLADLPKPAPVDLGPIVSRLAGAEAALNGLDNKVNGSDARLNGFDAKVNGIDGKVNGFDARMNGLDARVNGIEARANDVAALGSKLQSTVADLPKVDLQPLQAASGALDDKVSRLQTTVADLPKVDLQPLQAASTALGSRIATIETDLSAAKDGARVTEARAVGSADESKAAPIAVVGQAVQRAIADGRPYPSEVAALKALGGEPEAVSRLAPLADTGAPSVASLKSQWDGVKGDVLAAVKPGQSADPFDRLARNARALVKVTRVGTVSGNDPVAIAAQVDDALDREDVAGALTEWGKLPEAGQHASQGWADAAGSRVEAETAAKDLVARAIATLGHAKG